MAWIESHQELRNHPKTKRLAKTLKIQPYAAIGLLHNLWWWAVDYAPDGDLSNFEDWEIADATGYEKDASKLKSALVLAGFLDSDGDETFIHDWNDYAGRTLEQREKAKKGNRERQKKFRDRHNTEKTLQSEIVTGDGAETVTTNNAVSEDDVTDSNERVTRYGNATVTEDNAPTEHNNTVHDITQQDNTQHDNTDIPPNPPSRGSEGVKSKKPKPVITGIQEQRFDKFWELYPSKQGKGDARKAWAKIKPDEALFVAIMTSVKENKELNERWARGFIPNPSTWLNQTRWEDSLPVSRNPDYARQETRGPTGTDAVKDYLRGVINGGGQT